jgi:hypothetical protein
MPEKAPCSAISIFPPPSSSAGVPNTTTYKFPDPKIMSPVHFHQAKINVMKQGEKIMCNESEQHNAMQTKNEYYCFWLTLSELIYAIGNCIWGLGEPS